jgi:serine/threonine protein kinase
VAHCVALFTPAPEVLHKKLYGTEIDWWSFGVMLYEMMFWRLPFHGDADRLRYAILNEEPRFPKEADKHLANLIKGVRAFRSTLASGGSLTNNHLHLASRQEPRHPIWLQGGPLESMV